MKKLLSSALVLAALILPATLLARDSEEVALSRRASPGGSKVSGRGRKAPGWSRSEAVPASRRDATPNACTPSVLVEDSSFEFGIPEADASGTSGTAGPWRWSSAWSVAPFSDYFPRTGYWGAWLGGYGETGKDTVYQDVAIPADAVGAALVISRYIETEEASGSSAAKKDFARVELRDTSNTVLTVLKEFSNQDAGSSWTRHNYGLADYKGKTVRIAFVLEEDGQNATSFFIDDVFLIVGCSTASGSQSRVGVRAIGDGEGTITSEPAGMSVTSPGSSSMVVSEGTAVTLTAKAKTGSEFYGWLGECDSWEESCTFTVGSGGRAALGYFAAIPRTVDLSKARIRVKVDWKSQYSGESGTAFVIPMDDKFSFFYFTDPSNPEVFVKVLDFGGAKALCFVGGLSDFEYKVTFTSIRTGEKVEFAKPSGQLQGFATTSGPAF